MPEAGRTGSVLVTGATGFVGREACRAFADAGWRVRPAVRRSDPASAALPGEAVEIGEIGPDTRWEPALEGIDVVVHLAARVHMMSDRAADPMALYRAVNVRGTERLARAASEAGARRLVFVSSIKVNGEATDGAPFREEDRPQPVDPYGVSKWEAEQGLRAIGAETGLEVVVVRPPLVYGPGVKGNLQRLLRSIDRGVPLPLAGIENRRTLVGLTNLASLLVRCASHPDAAGEVFLAGDGEDVSTTRLVERMAAALGKPARLLPIPGPWICGAARLLGRPGLSQRLCGSLRIDNGKAVRLLGWTPETPMPTELEHMAAWYRAELAAGGSDGRGAPRPGRERVRG